MLQIIFIALVARALVTSEGRVESEFQADEFDWGDFWSEESDNVEGAFECLCVFDDSAPARVTFPTGLSTDV